MNSKWNQLFNRFVKRSFFVGTALAAAASAIQSSPAHAQFEWLPLDVLRMILSKTDKPTIGAMNGTNRHLRGKVNQLHGPFKEAREGMRLSWPGFDAFDKNFVLIPKGIKGIARLAQGPDEFEAFEVSATPVTRQDWMGVMGNRPPHFPCNGEDFNPSTDLWDTCPTCPVTCVNRLNQDGTGAEIESFLEILNTQTRALQCTYRLLTDAETWYVQRADASGTQMSATSYSLGVGDSNWSEYFSILGYRSDLGRMVFDVDGALDGSNVDVYPVGQMAKNAFKVEIGNVRRITSDQTLRGGSLANPPTYHVWDTAAQPFAPGDRFPDAGFSLARECIRPLEI